MEEVEEQNLVESEMGLETSSEDLGMPQLMDYREGKQCLRDGGGHAQFMVVLALKSVVYRGLEMNCLQGKDMWYFSWVVVMCVTDLRPNGDDCSCVSYQTAHVVAGRRLAQ